MNRILLRSAVASLVGLVWAGVAWAEEAAHGATEIAHVAAEGAPEKGLPQFNPKYVSSQVFWTLVAFAVLYVLMVRRVLPMIDGVIQARKDRIAQDLDAAEGRAHDTKAVQETAAAMLARARAQAAKVVGFAEADVAGIVARRQAELDRVLDRRAAEADARIRDINAAADATVRQVATEVSQALIQLSTGLATTDMPVAERVAALAGASAPGPSPDPVA